MELFVHIEEKFVHSISLLFLVWLDQTKKAASAAWWRFLPMCFIVTSFFTLKASRLTDRGAFGFLLPFYLKIWKRYRFSCLICISMRFQRILCMNYAGLFIHFLRLFCYDVVTKGKRKPLDYFTTNQCSSLFSPPLFFQRCPGLWRMTRGTFGYAGKSGHLTMAAWRRCAGFRLDDTNW